MEALTARTMQTERRRQALATRAAGVSTGLAIVVAAFLAGRQLVVSGQDTMRFSPDTLEVRAGEAVTLTLKNDGALLHDLVTKGASEDARITNVPGRGQKSATFRALSAGTYQVVCPQPGHTEAGMVARIVVTD